jgi:ABC-type multidrug transport system fused ATPase/permease subunit
VLLDNGVIAAVGTHQELLATNEKYREVLAAWSTPQVVE